MSHESCIRIRHSSGVIALFLVLMPAAVRAQASAVVDEGTFMVTQKGMPLGRESFRIVRTPAPGGQVFRATGQSALGDNRITTSLGTDSSGVPVSYESELTQRTEVVQRLQARGRPGRFSVLMQTKSGESAREYVLDNGALLIDEDVFHHFFFVPLAAQHSFIVIAPRASDQGRFTLQERGTEMVEIANRSIESRHLALIGPSGASRDVWIDGRGRLLKVAIPEKGLVALRDDPPR
jgi:hypothetical protein